MPGNGDSFTSKYTLKGFIPIPSCQDCGGKALEHTGDYTIRINNIDNKQRLNFLETVNIVSTKSEWNNFIIKEIDFRLKNKYGNQVAAILTKRINSEFQGSNNDKFALLLLIQQHFAYTGVALHNTLATHYFEMGNYAEAAKYYLENIKQLEQEAFQTKKHIWKIADAYRNYAKAEFNKNFGTGLGETGGEPKALSIAVTSYLKAFNLFKKADDYKSAAETLIHYNALMQKYRFKDELLKGIQQLAAFTDDEAAKLAYLKYEFTEFVVGAGQTIEIGESIEIDEIIIQDNATVIITADNITMNGINVSIGNNVTFELGKKGDRDCRDGGDNFHLKGSNVNVGDIIFNGNGGIGLIGDPPQDSHNTDDNPCACEEQAGKNGSTGGKGKTGQHGKNLIISFLNLELINDMQFNLSGGQGGNGRNGGNGQKGSNSCMGCEEYTCINDAKYCLSQNGGNGGNGGNSGDGGNGGNLSLNIFSNQTKSINENQKAINNNGGLAGNRYGEGGKGGKKGFGNTLKYPSSSVCKSKIVSICYSEGKQGLNGKSGIKGRNGKEGVCN